VGTIIQDEQQRIPDRKSNGLFTSPRRPRPPARQGHTVWTGPRCWGGVLQRGFYSILQSGLYTRNGMGFVRHCNCTEYLYIASCGCWKLPALCTYRAFSV
jgi:hypothetical protein